jgi:predicted amidohydrolase
MTVLRVAAAQLSDTVAPGNELVAFGYRDVTIGLATCYDLRFAEQFTALGRLGAELIVVPASWGAGPGKEEQWDLLTRARAADAQAWLLACDQAYVPPVGADPLGVGRSSLTTPLGQTAGRLDAGAGILHATVDTAVVGPIRARVPIL